MKQAAAVTGIPESVLKDAKAAGCAAFKHGRVDLALFLQWAFKDNSLNAVAVNWREALLEAQTKRERIKLMHDQDVTVDKEDVIGMISRGMALVFTALDRRSNLELPPALKGLPEAGIRDRLLKSDAELQEMLRSQFRALMEETKKEPDAQP